MSQPEKGSDLSRYLQEQLAHTGDGAVVVDAEQRILHWNEAAAVLLGYRSEEVLGKHCYEVMKTQDCDGTSVCCPDCPSLRDARKHQWASHQIVLAETKAGKLICLRIASFCLLSSDHKLSSLVHVFWDTGERPQLSDSEAKPPPGLPPLSPMPFLTTQERHVLGCLAAGMDTKAIAGALFISPTTVRNHIASILHKLGVHSRLEAVALAHHQHWM